MGETCGKLERKSHQDSVWISRTRWMPVMVNTRMATSVTRKGRIDTNPSQDGQGDFAQLFAALQPFLGVACLCEWKGTVEDRFQPPGKYQVHDGFEFCLGAHGRADQ